MRFVTYIADGETAVGLLTRDQKYVIHLRQAQIVKDDPKPVAHPLPDSLLQCIQMGEAFVEISQEILQFVEAYRKNAGDVSLSWLKPLESVQLLAPIPRPAKNIFCVGKNYAAHAAEMGGREAIPEHLVVFSKAPTAVTHPGAVVSCQSHVTRQMDYEGELAVVIGKRARSVTEEEAMDVVFGYTLINDLTARDLQARHQQWLIGKSLDGFCPMGPYLVTKEEVPTPERLKIVTRVNGEVRQSANTEQMIFTIPKIIATLSAGITLEPGDIIATGTPAGVGHAMNPPSYLQPGDLVEVEVEGLGVLKTMIGE
jgi:2-keto-4-pentenoate hydratase/2-oxohepta-3-ene-1,7-dioic acid hydratase in catechol pathway